MATALTIIKGAMRSIGVLPSGGTPTLTEQADCLEALNAMLDSWSTETLLVYHWPTLSFALSGQQSYTIGSGGDVDTTRPTFIDTAYVTQNGINFPVQVLTDRWRYDNIADKTVVSLADRIYYEPAYPLGKVYVYPVGDATQTLTLRQQLQPLENFASTGETMDLPPGYERALRFNLAVEIAPEFEAAVSNEVAGIALASKTNVKRSNNQHTPEMSFDRAIPSRHRYNIEVG